MIFISTQSIRVKRNRKRKKVRATEQLSMSLTPTHVGSMS